MKKNKLIVTKSNALVEAGYRLSLDEQRLILLAIGKIESRDAALTSKDSFTISAKEFAIFTKGDTSNSYRSIESASQDLFERRITFYEKDTGSVLVTRWVSAVKYNEASGTVDLRFAQDVLPLLTQIKGYFTQYNLENISQLSSIHAIRIYEFCLQYISTGKREMSLDEFKYFLGIEDLYPEFKALNQRVLKSSIKQINDHTDIKVKVVPIRKLRKIVSLRFEIESKKTRSIKLSNQKTNSELKKISSAIPHIPKKNPKQQTIPSFILNTTLN